MTLYTNREPFTALCLVAICDEVLPQNSILNALMPALGPEA